MTVCQEEFQVEGGMRQLGGSMELHVGAQVGGDQDGLVRGGQITKGLIGFALEVRFQPLHNKEQLDNFLNLNFEINF